MITPNLFIIGAPKCGTTALCEYLSEHPKICFSTPKEAKYFHTDFDRKHRYALDERSYNECFKNVNGNHEIIAEGTVWYLYSRVAVRNILEINPKAKFVVMIRNPVDLAYSLHSQLFYGGDESVSDFYSAWHLQDIRAQGMKVPFTCRDAKSLQYGSIASLGWQVAALLKLVDRKNVKFVVFDDFKDNPESTYREVLEFIGVDYDGKKQFLRVNENKALKPGVFPKILFLGSRLKDKLGVRKSMGLWKLLQPLVANKEPRRPLSSEFRSELKAYFDEDVKLLSTLVGRDLSHWTRLD